MRNIYILLSAVLITASVFAQSPGKMSYQAVIRNNSNQLVTNQLIGMQITILQGSTDGTPVYIETQTLSTNANGLVTFCIGTGSTSDEFSAINWANESYYIKTETDLTGGRDYSFTGITQLLSVPYALHAKTAESLIGTKVETDPIFGGSVAGSITPKDTSSWGKAIDYLLEGKVGYQRIGNLVMQFGSLISDSDDLQDFFYNEPFQNTCYTIFIQRKGENSKSILAVESIDKDGFTIDREDGINGEQRFYWFAIGDY